MGLKSYYIDTSPLSPEMQEKAIIFIENNAYTSQYIPHSKGCYHCEWEENINPLHFPLLSGCIVRELP